MLFIRPIWEFLTFSLCVDCNVASISIHLAWCSPLWPVYYGTSHVFSYLLLSTPCFLWMRSSSLLSRTFSFDLSGNFSPYPCVSPVMSRVYLFICRDVSRFGLEIPTPLFLPRYFSTTPNHTSPIHGAFSNHCLPATILW